MYNGYNGYNGYVNYDRRRFLLTSFDYVDNEYSDIEEEIFLLGRNLIRKFMFVDSLILDRWVEL